MRNALDDQSAFIEHMKKQGWIEGHTRYELLKGTWVVVFDTSSWIEVGAGKSARVFDVPVPEKHLFGWTEKLIAHLCETHDALATSLE